MNALIHTHTRMRARTHTHTHILMQYAHELMHIHKGTQPQYTYAHITHTLTHSSILILLRYKYLARLSIPEALIQNTLAYFCL